MHEPYVIRLKNKELKERKRKHKGMHIRQRCEDTAKLYC